MVFHLGKPAFGIFKCEWLMLALVANEIIFSSMASAMTGFVF